MFFGMVVLKVGAASSANRAKLGLPWLLCLSVAMDSAVKTTAQVMTTHSRETNAINKFFFMTGASFRYSVRREIPYMLGIL